MTLDEFKAELEKSPTFKNLDDPIKRLILAARKDQMPKYLEQFKLSDKKLKEAYDKYKKTTEEGLEKVKHEAAELKKKQRVSAEDESKAEDRKAEEELLKQL